MKCPKCGQETININNRDVCTVCGIVYDSATPREQLTNQIKDKVQTSVSSSEKQYVSPTEVHFKNSAPVQVSQTATQTIPPQTKLRPESNVQPSVKLAPDFPAQNVKSIPQGQVSQGVQKTPPAPTPVAQSQTVEAAPTPVVSPTPKPSEPATTVSSRISISTGPTPPPPSSEEKQRIMQETFKQVQDEVSTAPPQPQAVIQPSVTIQSTGINTLPVMEEKKEKGFDDRVMARNPEKQKEESPEGVKMALENEMPQMYAASGGEATQNIYPSHQINPIFLKALLSLFFLVLVVIALYILYINSHGIRVTIDNLIKYLGTSLFK